MKRAEALAIRTREVLLDGKWIANTNFREQLNAVSWMQACQKVGDMNTIALLTFHINYYLRGINDAFATGRLEIRDHYSFDAPPVASAEDWQNLVRRFEENAERFIRNVEALPDQKLDEPFFDLAYGTYLRNLDGMIEHAYYHLGQISLLRKLMG